MTAHSHGVVKLIRHAERPPLPAGSPGDTLALTSEGVRAAREFGGTLGGRLGRVVSSPVLRCVQTAEAILNGAGASRPCLTDRRLGNPGAWVADGVLVGPSFLMHGAEAVVRQQLRGPVDGMRSLEEGVRMLLQCLFAIPTLDGSVDVFVSHDAVIAPLVGVLIGTQEVEDVWPHFLESASFSSLDGRVQLTWRDTTYSLPAEVTHGS